MFNYGSSPSNVATTQYVTANDPSLPTRRVANAAPVYFNAGMFRIYGSILALLAAATLALGIADVVLTSLNYCSPPRTCSSSSEPYIWVWIASGIWGSVPIFLAGLFAMCIGRNPLSWTRIFALLVFLSAFVFAPAIVVLSAIEIWRGWSSASTFYTLTGSVGPGTIMSSNNSYQAKFGIPLAIAILGGIMFLMTAFVSMCLCCCMNCLGIYTPAELNAMQPVPAVQPSQGPLASSTMFNNQVYYPPRPQVKATSYYSDYPADQYSRYPALPYSPAVRYNNNVSNPYGSGALFGNSPYRTGNSFANQFMGSNPSWVWNWQMCNLHGFKSKPVVK